MNLAAVWELILDCEWGRILWGITHAHWANVWASISAIFTALAVIVAAWAMMRWRKQDELKAKMLFKQAIAEYVYVLVQLPDSLGHSPKELEQGAKTPNLNENLETLKVRLRACHFAWIALEGLLEKDKIVKESWNFIYDNHANYMLGKIKSKDLGNRAIDILEKKFVFK